MNKLSRIANRAKAVLSWLKDALSKPFVGPILTLIVLAISIATYTRQGRRWAEEDLQQLTLHLAMQELLSPQRMRLGKLCFVSRLSYVIRVVSVSTVRPPDGLVTTVKDGTLTTAKDPSRSVEIDNGQGFENSMKSACVELLFKLPTIPNDQNSMVEVKASFAEINGERSLSRTAVGLIPLGASTIPRLFDPSKPPPQGAK